VILKRSEAASASSTLNIRLRKDGGTVDISLTISPIRNTLGNIIGLQKSPATSPSASAARRKIATLAGKRAPRQECGWQPCRRPSISPNRTRRKTQAGDRGTHPGARHVHNLFVESRWAGAPLHNLVTQELAPYCREGEPRARSRRKRSAGTDAAQAIAVCLHELATNAAK